MNVLLFKVIQKFEKKLLNMNIQKCNWRTIHSILLNDKFNRRSEALYLRDQKISLFIEWIFGRTMIIFHLVKSSFQALAPSQKSGEKRNEHWVCNLFLCMYYAQYLIKINPRIYFQKPNSMTAAKNLKTENDNIF